MQEIYKWFLAGGVLLLGFLAGEILTKITQEELKEGKKYFKIICYISVIGSIFGFILGKDDILLTFLFILLATSRSLFYQDKSSILKKKKGHK